MNTTISAHRASYTLAALCLACAGLCLALASCNPSPIVPTNGSNTGTPSERLAATNNDFALTLFKEIAATESNSNVFCSPFSYMQALTMTWNGANAATRDSMTKTLRLQGISEQDANAGLKSLSDTFRTLDTNVEFRTANGIWYNSRFTPEPNFVSTVQNAFGAEVRGKVFGTDAVKDDINKWVENKTNNRIKDLIQKEFTREDLMCLVNAVYFNGAWKFPFNATLTGDGMFTRENGSTRLAKLMATGTAQSIRQANLGNAKMVELPYGNDRFVMTALLPNHGTKLGDVIGGLTLTSWNAAVQQLSSSATAIVMPKFTMKTRYEERSNAPRELHKMGMGLAFTDRADFSKMYRPPLTAAISFVIHQTFLQVDERGTEAAAATAVGIIRTTAIETPAVVRFDKPFAFVIRDRTTGTILFAGAVYEP